MKFTPIGCENYRKFHTFSLVVSDFSCIFAPVMSQMQFTGFLIMALLTVKLMSLSVRSVGRETLNHVRWLMVGCTGLLGLQFLAQMVLGLRTTGHIAQAVALNVACFIPCSAMMSLAILYLLREWRVTWLDRWIGLFAWIPALLLLYIGLSTDGHPLTAKEMQVSWPQIGSTMFFAALQLYYFIRHMYEMQQMHRALDSYFDRDAYGMLRWMRMSIILLALMALFAPVVIFSNSLPLAFYGLFTLCGFFYFVDSFGLYVVSSSANRVMEADQNARKEEEVAAEMTDKLSDDSETKQRIKHAVERWIECGGYLKSGMNMPSVASEIGIPQYQLTSWLRQQNCKYSEWMTSLRIEEAKRVIVSHPDWSNESVAEHCGFSDRTYFQKKFKEKTGMTPADYMSLHQ